MRVGQSYEKAKRHAQVAANFAGFSRWIVLRGEWWYLSTMPVEGGEEVKPSYAT